MALVLAVRDLAIHDRTLVASGDWHKDSPLASRSVNVCGWLRSHDYRWCALVTLIDI